MQTDDHTRDSSLLIKVLRVFEHLEVPYMVVGAFAGTVFGIGRLTYDIDIVAHLTESDVSKISNAFPFPRYYADEQQIIDSMRMGVMFNIIDSTQGEKADIIPLSARGSAEFSRRIRVQIEPPGGDPFDIWSARPEDIIIGKLRAWQQGGARKHETDIYDILAFTFRGRDATSFDIPLIEEAARKMGEDVLHLWTTIKESAR